MISRSIKKRAETITFINVSLNKMLETEKPSKIVITAPIKHLNMNKFSKQTKKCSQEAFQALFVNDSRISALQTV